MQYIFYFLYVLPTGVIINNNRHIGNSGIYETIYNMKWKSLHANHYDHLQRSGMFKYAVFLKKVKTKYFEPLLNDVKYAAD